MFHRNARTARTGVNAPPAAASIETIQPLSDTASSLTAYETNPTPEASASGPDEHGSHAPMPDKPIGAILYAVIGGAIVTGLTELGHALGMF